MGGLPVAVRYATSNATETYATQLSFSFDVPLVYNLSSTNFEAEGYEACTPISNYTEKSATEPNFA